MDLKGRRFGRLFVIDLGTPYTNPSSGYQQDRYNCVCDCGKIKLIRASSLVSGCTRSCGCLARESVSARSTTHGHSRNKLFSVWLGMHRRCYNSRSKDYKHYGGRGISVCERWRQKFDGIEPGFMNFLEDMESTFIPGLEIERVLVDGDYRPENCIWETRRNQVINRREMCCTFDTHFIELDGKRLCISQWEDETGIPSKVISDRIGKLGWDTKKALTTPVRPKRVVILYENIEFTPDTVFKSPPNHYLRASKLDIPFYQYCANLLPRVFKIKILVNREWYDVEPNEINLKMVNNNFKESFYLFCKEKGVEI